LNTEIIFPSQFKLANGRTTNLYSYHLMPSPRLELRTLAGYITKWATFNVIFVKEYTSGEVQYLVFLWRNKFSLSMDNIQHNCGLMNRPLEDTFRKTREVGRLKRSSG